MQAVYMMELLLLEINSLFYINITYKINVDHVEVYFIFNKSKCTSDKVGYFKDSYKSFDIFICFSDC